MLECVINISEGSDSSVLDWLKDACARSLLDVHTDTHHHRSVFTLAGANVEDDARALASAAVGAIDLRNHDGAHPRIGAIDVVPFVPLFDTTFDSAVRARNAFALWLAETHDIPCFFYGPERSLPDVRKNGFRTIAPDTGPAQPHPNAGACAVGARNVLVAYNLWLHDSDIDLAKHIARTIRSPHLRTLGLAVGDQVQVSCNLVEPATLGPVAAYDAVAKFADIERAELVGLVPQAIIESSPPGRLDELDLSREKTIEARLSAKR